MTAGLLNNIPVPIALLEESYAAFVLFSFINSQNNYSCCLASLFLGGLFLKISFHSYASFSSFFFFFLFFQPAGAVLYHSMLWEIEGDTVDKWPSFLPSFLPYSQGI